MTENSLPLAELLAKAGNPDFLRQAAQTVVQMLMEADVDSMIGPTRHEHSGERTTYRNGCSGLAGRPGPNRARRVPHAGPRQATSI